MITKSVIHVINYIYIGYLFHLNLDFESSRNAKVSHSIYRLALFSRVSLRRKGM